MLNPNTYRLFFNGNRIYIQIIKESTTIVTGSESQDKDETTAGIHSSPGNRNNSNPNSVYIEIDDTSLDTLLSGENTDTSDLNAVSVNHVRDREIFLRK